MNGNEYAFPCGFSQPGKLSDHIIATGTGVNAIFTPVNEERYQAAAQPAPTTETLQCRKVSNNKPTSTHNKHFTVSISIGHQANQYLNQKH